MRWKFAGKTYATGKALARHVSQDGEANPAWFVRFGQFIVEDSKGNEIFRRSYTTHVGFNRIREQDGDQ